MKNASISVSVLILLLTFLFDMSASVAQDESRFAACVGEVKISEARVQRHLDRTLGERKVSDEQLEVLKAEALQHLINRELVDHFLSLRNYQVGDSQVQLQVDILTANLDRVEKTLDAYLKEETRTRAELEREIVWKIRWSRYLEKTLTDLVLNNYFDRHRRKFDGTEIRVAQILFRTLDSTESVNAAMELANKKRAELSEGELTWAKAVEQNSVAASRAKGGEVGWIRYNEPMPREFSQVAFELETDDLAEPFASKFGVHLLKCLEIKPGSADFGDVRQAVVDAATKELFERIANRHQTEIDIEYGEGWRAGK